MVGTSGARSAGVACAAEAIAVGDFTGPMNRKPRRCTVWMYRGAADESPRARRRSRMPLARAASLTIASRHTVVSSSSFVINRPWCSTRWRRTANARGASVQSSRSAPRPLVLGLDTDRFRVVWPRPAHATPSSIPRAGAASHQAWRRRRSCSGDCCVSPRAVYRSPHAPPSEPRLHAKSFPSFHRGDNPPAGTADRVRGPLDRPVSGAVPQGSPARAIARCARSSATSQLGFCRSRYSPGLTTRRQHQCASYAMTATHSATAALGAIS